MKRIFSIILAVLFLVGCRNSNNLTNEDLSRMLVCEKESLRAGGDPRTETRTYTFNHLGNLDTLEVETVTDYGGGERGAFMADSMYTANQEFCGRCNTTRVGNVLTVNNIYDVQNMSASSLERENLLDVRYEERKAKLINEGYTCN